MNAQEKRLTARVSDLQAADNAAGRLPSEWTDPGDDPLGPDSPWHQWDLDSREGAPLVYRSVPLVCQMCVRHCSCGTRGIQRVAILV